MLSKMMFARAVSRRTLGSFAGLPLLYCNRAIGTHLTSNLAMQSSIQTGIRSFANSTTNLQSTTTSPCEVETLSRVQHALLEALISCSSEPLSSSRRDAIAHELQHLPLNICPKKLEMTQEDHTLLIPQGAFQSECFNSVLQNVLGQSSLDEETWDDFWKTFAYFYHSPRVVRCDSAQSSSSDNVLWPH